jgi:hypothetical protein
MTSILQWESSRVRRKGSWLKLSGLIWLIGFPGRKFSFSLKWEVGSDVLMEISTKLHEEKKSRKFFLMMIDGFWNLIDSVA